VARAAICISHATGAGGEAVGRAVASRLGYRYVDDEVIERAAEWADLDPDLVADVERRKPLVARMLAVLGQQSVPSLVAVPEPARTLPVEADLRFLIVDVLRAAAAEGSVVLVAHAASFALAGEDVLRVLVTASSETRAARLAAGGLDRRAAEKEIAGSDAARADYLSRFYGVKRELPTHFDLVVNTDVLTPEQAADVVVAAAATA